MVLLKAYSPKADANVSSLPTVASNVKPLAARSIVADAKSIINGVALMHLKGCRGEPMEAWQSHRETNYGNLKHYCGVSRVMAPQTRKLFSATVLTTLLVNCAMGFAQKKDNPVEQQDRVAAERVDKNPQYFPSTFNSFERVWYHGQLATCQEPSLYENRLSGDTIYRFSWIPSFHHTICARLTLKDDGTGTLELKQLSGAGGYNPGHLASSQTIVARKDEVQSVLVLIGNLNFWHRADGEINNQSGTDGSEWVLEGISDGKYRIVEMWSPSSGPLVDVGRLMVETIGNLHGKDVLSY
jgi:hypothetical protein